MRTRNRIQRRGGFVLVAVALAALFGGSAFTASNTGTATATVGYGEVTVSGANVESVSYNLNSTTDNVDTLDLALVGDTTATTVSVGLNNGARLVCSAGVFGTTLTTYTCPGTGTFTQAASTLTSTQIAVAE